MKKLLAAVLLLPILSMAQTFQGFTIENQSKATITGGATVAVSNVTTNSVFFLLGKDTLTADKVDSVFIWVESTGTTPFAAQIGLGIGNRNPVGFVAIKASGTGLQKFAVPVAAFGVRQFNAIKFYLTSVNKLGWKITAVEFHLKYVPPVSIPVPEKKPEKVCSDSILIDVLPGYELLHIKGANGTDTLRQIKKKL